jgi:hypothetical protein
MSDNIIADLTIGDDYDIERDVEGIPEETVLSKAWLMIKDDEDDADEASLVTKEITEDEVSGVGQIMDTGADGTGHVFFQLTDADTETLTAFQRYWWGIKVLTDTDKKYTVLHGLLIPLGRIIEAEA